MLARRIGVEEAECPLQGDELSYGSDALFSKAFEVAPEDPKNGTMLLGCALLAVAHETTDGRHKSALLLLARLVGNADGRMTLGPPGASKRSELFPTGWKEMAHSWPRLRYAWREGLEDLLSPPESEQATVLALDEITRIHPAEKEPVPVTIQEVFPSPVVSFIVSAAGLALSMRLMFKDWQSGSRRRR